MIIFSLPYSPNLNMAGHIHIDESPFRFLRFRRFVPNWLKRFLPSGGGQAEDHHGKGMFGFTVFILSESIIFISFILTYVALRTTHSDWLPPGVKGPDLSTQVIIASIILLSSSLVIQPAENALKRNKLGIFRALWFTTTLMGAYFLVSEGIEWSKLNFGLDTGIVGETFYLLTGFHGLHVFTGITLQTIMLIRSFLPGNYNQGHVGVSMVTLFWHFVDAVWIILFSILYLWRS